MLPWTNFHHLGSIFFTRERSSKGLLFLLVHVLVLVVVRIDVSQIKAFLVNLTPPSTF
jgi:hypothetical protein